MILKTKQFHGRFIFCLLALAGVFLFNQVALAQDVTDDDVNRVATQLFCPTCESVPVDVCPTQVCQDWRNEIRNQLLEGRSDQEILTYFADRYGEGVLANAPTEGFGLIIWIAPVLIVLLGLVIFVRYLRQIRQPETAGGPISPLPDSDILSQIEAELEKE